MELTSDVCLRSSSTKHRVRALAVVGAVMMSSLGMALAPTSFASAATLTVSTPVASAGSLPPSGGAITLLVTSSVTATCSASAVAPTQPDVPGSAVTCTAGVAVKVPLLLPGNPTTAPLSYKVSVQACAIGSCVDSTAVTVAEWAYKLTITPTSAPWGAPTSVSCPTVSFCMVADGSSYVYTTSGKTYRRVLLQQGRLIDAVACASSTQCIAGDIDGDAYVFSGTKWRVDDGLYKDANAVALIGAVSPGRKSMLQWVNAAASGSSSHSNGAVLFNGTSFLPAIQYNTPGVVTGVSCPVATTECYAVDDEGYLTSFGGSSGPVSTLVSTIGTPLTSISCSSSVSCVVGGDAGFVRTFRPGRPTFGTVRLSSTTNVIGVSCPTNTVCFVNSGTTVTIASGDLDGDGDPDLVATSSARNPTSSRLLVADVPGVTTYAQMVGNHKDITGHVTLIR